MELSEIEQRGCPYTERTRFPRVNLVLCQLWDKTGVEPFCPFEPIMPKFFGENWKELFPPETWPPPEFWEDFPWLAKVAPSEPPTEEPPERPPLTTGWDNWWGPFGRWGPDYPDMYAVTGGGVGAGGGPSAVGKKLGKRTEKSWSNGIY